MPELSHLVPKRGANPDHPVSLASHQVREDCYCHWRARGTALFNASVYDSLSSIASMRAAKPLISFLSGGRPWKKVSKVIGPPRIWAAGTDGGAELSRCLARRRTHSAGSSSSTPSPPAPGTGTRISRPAYLVPALLLAHLAIPAQLLKPLGFDPVGNGLGGKEI